MAEETEYTILQKLLGFVGFGYAVLYLPLAILWGWAGPSAFGWVILASGAIIWIGLFLGSRGKTGPIFSLVGVVLIAGTLGLHHVSANSAASTYIRSINDPAPLSTLQLLPEHDMATVGARTLSLIGYFSERGETGPIAGPMSATYQQMFVDHFAVPNPALRSREVVADRKEFDILVFEPAQDAGKSIIFLHGYGGNWAMPCWMVAHEATKRGFRVYCPTLDKNADWTGKVGRKIVARVFEMNRGKTSKIILGGISNGAIGASVLSHQFSGEVSGVLLIAGAANRSKPGGKPFIAFHGRDDKMSPILPVRAYAASADKGKLHELDGGHFAVLQQRDLFWSEFGHWLAEF